MIDKIVKEDIGSIINSIGAHFQELAGKTVLITGADGFIGSYFIDTLLILNETILRKNPVKIVMSAHHKITKDSRLSHCLEYNGIKFIIGDVVNVSLPRNINFIIHAASKASPKDYLSHPIETVEVNVLGTRKLLEYCIREKVSRFLLIGSGEIYGDPDLNNVPISETYTGNVDPVGPRSAYQESKRFAETLCHLYWKAKGVNIVIARLFHTYGPRLFLNDGRVIPEFIKRSLVNNEIRIINGGGSIRTFSYISDSIEGMCRILLFGQFGQAYNVGSKEEVSINKLAKLIIKLSESKSKIVMVPDTKISHLSATPMITTPSLKKIRELGFTPKISLENGLKRLISWYREYGIN